MKHSTTALVGACLFTFSASASALGDKNLNTAQAEKLIMQSCIEDNDNTKAQCVCVLGGLKEELPKADYKLMINLVTLTMNGDFEGVRDYAQENDVGIFKLKKFGDELERVGKILEEKCDDPDVKLDLEL
jgi:hypothetical protein